MSNNIVTGKESIGVGEIKFYDSIQPPLTAGAYTLKATQAVKGLPGESSAPGYSAEQSLNVDGPRFTLNPAQISSVFPPANQLGHYDNSLPHIVFNNFALPWSREINPLSPDINQTPWVGLLTLYPDDLASAANPDANVAPLQTVTLAELIQPADAKVLPPTLGQPTEPLDTKVLVVDMNLAFFQAIAPTCEELPYLAHGRQVDTDGKVMMGMDADGCFSLVVGNRLPISTPNGLTRNSVYLVSYEGHQDHLHGATISGDYDKIRLVLLGSWEFTAATTRGSFIQLMEDLCDEGRGGVTLYQMPRKPAPGARVDPNPVTEEALDIGYVALQNDMRVGEEATSWYRGPLVPAPTARDYEYGPYIFSDHAIHYDPETGVFNHAYSSAWQIGRLLALSDASFSQSLFKWRMNYITQVSGDAKREQVQDKAVSLLASTSGIEAANLVTATGSTMATKFSKVDWPTVTTRARATLGDQLPGVMSDDEMNEIHRNDADPLIELGKKLKGGRG